MTNKERMLAGEIYDPADASILGEQTRCLERQYDYNATRPGESARRAALLKEMFLEIGEGCYIEPPLHANWGGAHVRLGDAVYANFGLTLVDDAEITIGSRTMIGPNVVIATGAHPILPALRARGLQYNLPVHIGEDVWIGAGALILPGVTIGAGSVIGAGAVVTHDIPANVVAVGTPCRVVREIGERDRVFYARGRRIDPVWLDEE